MFLAAEAAQAAHGVEPFNFFILAFTVLIAIGVIRVLTAPKKNLFAIGFGLVSLAVFLFMDVVMFKTGF